MAESKKVKNTDIIENDLFGNAKKSANELKIVLGGLNDTLIETAKAQAKVLQGSKNPSDAKDLKELDKILNEAQKTRIALIAVKKQELQLEREMLATAKAKAQADKQAVKDTQVTTSAYDALRKKYNDLSRAQIELSVRGRENGKVFRGIKIEADAMRLALDKAEQGAGRHQRNVGNYKSAYDGLGNSINQLTREMPAFANSVQTGFMAISNNLPMLFDQIEKIKNENAALAAEGKKGTSILQQLGGAIFSWGTLLSVGVTLLTVYGKQMVEFIGTLFEAEKALESVTEAEKEYGKSINKTQENIEDLKLQIKIKSGLISKETGAILMNEIERRRAMNETKELRKKTFADLWKETEMTQKLLESDGKKRLVITQGGESREENILDYSEQKRVDRYKAGLKREKELMLLENAKINEYYNLKAKLIEIDEESDKKKRTSEENLIDLKDQIIRKNIENETDTKQRAINLAKDLERIAIKEVEAIKATYQQKQLLILAIQQDTYNKLIEIDDKYAKLEIDKINAKYEKILAEQDKNIAAIQKISLDNKDYNLFLLEEQYSNEKKLGDKANKQKLDDLQKQILEEKKLLIQKRADIEKEGKNITEQEAIQNKADIDIKKLRPEKQAENDLKVTKKYNEEITRLLLIEIDKRSKKEQDAFDRDLKKRAKTIDIQRKLAEDGLENQLAFEEAQRDKAELKKREAEEKAQKEKEITQLVDAYFNALNARLQTKGTNPSTAAALALSDVLLAKGISKGIAQVAKDGNEDVQPLNGVGGQIGVDDIPFMLTRNEAVVTREANMKHKGVVKSLNDGTFEQKFQNKDNEKMITLLEQINSKPVQQVDVDGLGNLIETIYINGRKDVTKYINKPNRI